MNAKRLELVNLVDGLLGTRSPAEFNYNRNLECSFRKFTDSQEQVRHTLSAHPTFPAVRSTTSPLLLDRIILVEVLMKVQILLMGEPSAKKHPPFERMIISGKGMSEICKGRHALDGRNDQLHTK